MNTLGQVQHNHRESCITSKIRKEGIKLRWINEGLTTQFVKLYWQWKWNDVEKKRTSQTWNCFQPCPHTLSEKVYWLDLVQQCWRHKKPSAALVSFSRKLKANGIITARQYMIFQTFSNLQFRPLLFKKFFIVFTIAWKMRALKEYPFYLSV